jgi:flagellar protein FlbD
MILLTRLTGRPLIVNVEMIKTVEETPDTMITLLNNDHLMVKETMAEVVRRAIEYGRQVRCFVTPADPHPPEPAA